MRIRMIFSAVLALSLAAVVPAQASGGTPDDQPLPGYTIVNPPLAPATVGGQPTRVLQGVHGHAAYDIEVPPQWNGKLTMWAHGYRGQGKVLTVEPPGAGLRQRLLDQGFAWAASSYYDNGYDVKAGVTTTRELASLFGKLVKRPKQVFIAGASMGGHVVGRSIEEYPGFYAGALPMCGVLGDQALFDFFTDYNLVAQDLSGVTAYPVPADYETTAVPKIEQTLGLNGTLTDRGAQLRAITVERSGGPRPGADASFQLWKHFLFTIAVPTGGDSLPENPAQLATNVFTRYTPNTPVDVNRTVRRVPPENLWARFNPALTQIPRIAGTPTAPVLSLHGLGDMFVPFSMEQLYRDDVARHGRTGSLVQRAIRTGNHCEFSNAEVGAAWDDLRAWVETGKRPAGDVVNDRRVVAAPDYGCKFTDKAATGGTRGLFPKCG
ncbi:hypothetical protein SAMN05421504_104114 [Amycolatopsis xylanica]|uniref:Prolyl oligopeptidase family protein n=1 Tax=Amycolatopsis xylanica TaxID=589385 RepID=A0A1H3G3H3_9PSEU|nr:hypothetical protein [Amycolatopsis xylanica]SDX97882.1 hypothetical protein SAMN05421504_104114 [Amycolatopsis xylanica]